MCDQKDTPAKSTQPSQDAETPAGEAKKQRSSQSDWKPLGVVRDYFVEQMRQDRDW